MSLQEWVEIRSRELQTKENEKGTDNEQAVGTVGGQDVAEPRGEHQETTGRAARERGVEVEEVSEIEAPLVRKRRRLIRAGDMRPVGEKVSAEEAMSTRDTTE